MAKETAEQTMARYLKGDEYGYPAAPTCDGDDTDNSSQSIMEHDEGYFRSRLQWIRKRLAITIKTFENDEEE